jgi:hypothetical protein
MDARRGRLGATVAGIIVTGGGLMVAGTANAATATVTGVVTTIASDDTYTSSIRKTTNFASADKLVVGKADGETRVSYVKFSTGALPPGATVTGAELSLPLESKPIAATLSLYPVGTSWTEAKVTASAAPTLSAAVVSIKPAVSDTVLRFDVSTWVTKAGSYAFALKSAATAGVTRFRSVEYGDPKSGGPELQIRYSTKVTTPTPKPTTPKPTTPPATTTPPTTAPATTAPTATPTTTAPTTTAPTACVTDALLVPSCGVLWGAAAGGFTDTPRDEALRQWEATTGRTATIYHRYHKGDETFPTKSEIAMTQDAAHPRVLLLNWKVAYGSTWAEVAAGGKDARIDNWAAYVRANYGDRKFFLALHHEPENDVDATAGSGMTAKDYAAMYRHVVQRLRADGVTNAINVIAYMGNEKWMAQSWWQDLYPGDDVVDWIGLDSYVSVEPGYYHYGDLGDALDRGPTGGGLGWYDWAVQNHPGKPVMVAEWGMYHRVAVKTDKAAAYASVLPELTAHPQVKAIVYFDTASDDEGDRDISVNSLPSSLAAFRTLAADAVFTVAIGQ